MKKIKFMVMTILLTSVLFTGCSKPTPNTGKGEKSVSSNSSDSVKSGEDSAAETVLLIGKVNVVTGNELEILLAKDPYADQKPENGGNADNNSSAAGTVAPPIEAGEEVPQTPKMQLEYTGEVKNVTIPAGANILDQTGGEVKLDSIKKGSVLMIMMENDSVKEVGILE